MNKVINTLKMSTHPLRRYMLFSVLVGFIVEQTPQNIKQVFINF